MIRYLCHVDCRAKAHTPSLGEYGFEISCGLCTRDEVTRCGLQVGEAQVMKRYCSGVCMTSGFVDDKTPDVTCSRGTALLDRGWKFELVPGTKAGTNKHHKAIRVKRRGQPTDRSFRAWGCRRSRAPR